MIEAEAVVAGGALKTTCARDELLRALGIVSRGVSTRTTVQILAGTEIESPWSDTEVRMLEVKGLGQVVPVRPSG